MEGASGWVIVLLFTALAETTLVLDARETA